MRTIHIGIGPDRYDAIQVSDEDATVLIQHDIIYPCGNGGQHDLHLMPDGPLSLALNERIVRAFQVSSASDQVKGLPVSGYKATQPQEAIDAVNVFKELEERTLRHAEAIMSGNVIGGNYDGRFLSIGITQLQQAFMALNRAIFQPQRVPLPEDAQKLREAEQNAGGYAVDAED